MNIFKLPSKEREKEINNILSNTTSDELLKELIECGLEVTMNDKEAIERLNRFKTIKVIYGNTFAMHLEQLKQLQQDLETILNLIEKQKEEIEKKDKEIKCLKCLNNKQVEIIDLMAEDKYENINMIQMANIGKEINYDPTKLFNGIPDEEALKIIKQYFEKKAEEDK